MLIKHSDLNDYSLQALDGTIGKGKNMLFDDLHWTVRYVDVNTRKWLIGHRVLISPYAVKAFSPSSKTMVVSLTKAQIQDAPGLAEHEPISEQYERLYHNYFGYPGYWTGYNIWGASEYPILLNSYRPPLEDEAFKSEKEQIARSHLRSMKEVVGYVLSANDGHIGKVVDFIVDTSSWQIRYLVAGTHRWMPGAKVLIPSSLVGNVSWEKKSIALSTNKQTIQTAPTVESVVNQQDELDVHRHFNLKPYWLASYSRAAND